MSVRKYDDPALTKEIMARLTYVSPKAALEQPARYEEIRAAGRAFAEVLLRTTPKSREQSLAFTALEEAVMWANAAIARNEV